MFPFSHFSRTKEKVKKSVNFQEPVALKFIAHILQEGLACSQQLLLSASSPCQWTLISCPAKALVQCGRACEDTERSQGDLTLAENLSILGRGSVFFENSFQFTAISMQSKIEVGEKKSS